MNNAILTANFRKQFPGGPEIVAQDLSIGGGITVLFGASGSGKTTLLRCLAGLEIPDAGEIKFGDEVWFRKSGKRKAETFLRQRSCGTSVLCHRITHCFHISQSHATSATV